MNLFKRHKCTTDRCACPYYYRFELYGRAIVRSARTNDAKRANRIAHKAYNDVLERRVGIASARAPKLDEHIEAYLRWAQNDHPATADLKDARVLAEFSAVVGNRPLDKITTFDIERWRSVRARAVERSTVNRELNVVRGCFTKAIEWGYVTTNPTPAAWRVDGARVRVLSTEELATLFQEAPTDLALICRVTLECLPRLSEVLGIRRTDIGPTWVQIRRKGGRVDRIPITSELRSELLNNLPALNRRTQAAASVAFTRLFRKLKIAGVSHHTLRHTGVTLMLDAGVNPQAIQRLAGWTSLRMLERYGHVRDAELVRAVELNAAVREQLPLQAPPACAAPVAAN